MLNVFLEKVSGYFDKRFLFSVWFPSFLFGAAAVVVAAIAKGTQATVDAWSGLPVVTQSWLSVGGLIMVTFFAYVCDNLLGTIVRFYEGYWPEWADGLRRVLVGIQRRRWQHLQDRLDLAFTQGLNVKRAFEKIKQSPIPDQDSASDGTERSGLEKRVKQFRSELDRISREKYEQRGSKVVRLSHQLQSLRSDIREQYDQVPSQRAAWENMEAEITQLFTERCREEQERLGTEYNRLYARLYRTFPQTPARLMPTRLGNVIRAAEEYSQCVYHFDAPTVWPRLVQLLPSEFQARLEQSSTPLTAMLFCSTLSFLFAIIGGSVLFFVSSQWWLFLSAVAGGLLLCSWCYESAVYRAVEYGTLIRTAFDLYRHELLKALRVPLPPSPLEEWKLWPQLMQWWYHYELPFADKDKPAWFYEGKKPTIGSPKRDEHVLYLKLGVPSEEDEK